MSRTRQIAFTLGMVTLFSGPSLADTVNLGLLHCVPVLGEKIPATVRCNPAVDGKVDTDTCTCPSGFLLIQTSTPGAIVKTVSPT